MRRPVRTYAANEFSGPAGEMRQEKHIDALSSTGLRNAAINESGVTFQAFDPAGNEYASSSLPGIVSRRRAQAAYAASSAPLEHLNGLQFVNVHRDPSRNTNGLYTPSTRTIDLRHAATDWTHPAQRAMRYRTPVHELGHHVDTVRNGPNSSAGTREARAENYADRYAHGNAPSIYDAYAAKGRSDVFNRSRNPDTEMHLYRHTRSANETPGSA